MMHLFIDILRNSILITGLVVVMMMMIESLNIESKGMVFKGLRKTKFGDMWQKNHRRLVAKGVFRGDLLSITT